MKSGCRIVMLVFFFVMSVGVALAAGNFDLSCDTPVTVVEQFDGEIKYHCTVKNTGASSLQLSYEAQPEQNPINPMLAVGFHPQPPVLYLEAGETQQIEGFEVPPRVPAGENQITFTRTIIVRPADGTADTKQAVITTVVKSEQLNEESSVFGKILDARTKQPVRDSEVLFKYKRLERRSRTSPQGDYRSSLPELQYLMMVNAKGYELFSEIITPQGETKKDIFLNRAREKGSYDIVKEVKLDSGAWEGVWRARASDNGQYVAFGTGGHPTGDGLEGYFYVYDVQGTEILKVKTVDEVRGIDIASDGSRVAVSLGDTQRDMKSQTSSQFEKVMLYKSTGELVWKKFLDTIAFHEVKFSHDGRLIAAGDAEGYVYLLDAADGREIWKRFTNGQVRAITFYDDDSYLLVGSGDNNVRLFDIKGNEQWKSYVHSWPYGFIATTHGNAFSVAGGHIGVLHLLDKNGKDVWSYEADGGFRWAEIGPEASFVVGGTRSELAFLDAQGKVRWKGQDSVSGAATQDGAYIVSGNQKGEIELRDITGTILWEHRTQDMEPGRDVRFVHISDDKQFITAAVKTGEVYFFKGGLNEPDEIMIKETLPENREYNSPVDDNRRPPRVDLEARPLQQNLLWIAAGSVIVIFVIFFVRKKRLLK